LLRLKIVHPHYSDRGKFEIDEIFLRKEKGMPHLTDFLKYPDPKNPKVLIYG